jgi:hypothetical protein
MIAVRLLLQDAAVGVGDAISDALVPIGGGALIAVCLRLAVTAYKDAMTVSRDREKVCVDTLSTNVEAQRALTAEVKAASEDERAWRVGHDQRLGQIERSLAELLGRYNRHVEP